MLMSLRWGPTGWEDESVRVNRWRRHKVALPFPARPSVHNKRCLSPNAAVAVR
jgi:hypothetical protein